MEGIAPNTYDQDLQRLWSNGAADWGRGAADDQESQVMQWTSDDEDIPEPAKTLAPTAAARNECAPTPRPVQRAGPKIWAARCSSKTTAPRAGKSLRVSRFIVDKYKRIVLQHPPAGTRLCTGRKGARVLAPATKADFEQFATLFKP